MNNETKDEWDQTSEKQAPTAYRVVTGFSRESRKGQRDLACGLRRLDQELA
jgi:hypothetical protein